MDSYINIASKNSMIGIHRLNNLLNQLDYIINNDIGGAIIECGVWKGGAICMAKKYLKDKNNIRNVYAFDSFEGLPKPDDSLDFMLSNGIKASTLCGVEEDVNNNCFSSLETFYKTMDSFKLERNDIIIKKGWFENTCKNFEENIALLRFDGDWYKSTLDVLNNLYDKVLSGGVLIFDDYSYWNGNKQAVDTFMKDKHHKQYNYTSCGEMWFIK